MKSAHHFIGDHSIKSDPESQIIGEHDQYNVKSDDERSTEFDNNGFTIKGASNTLSVEEW